MRNALTIAFVAVIVLLGLLLIPTSRMVTTNADLSQAIPLTSAGVKLLPYGFIFFVGFAAWKFMHRS
jgi:hypothetical protein